MANTKKCRSGHEYTPENTRIDKRGSRQCRTCFRIRDRDSKKRRLLENPQRERLRSAKRYQSNRKKNLERCSQYKKGNPQKVRAWNRSRRARTIAALGLWHQFEIRIEELLYHSQKGLCYYCRHQLDWENRKKSPLEHMVPLKRGGTHGINNWCISCEKCNSRKGAKTAEEFILVLSKETLRPPQL